LQIVSERSETVGIGTEPAGHGAVVSNLERALLDAASRPSLVGGYFPFAEALAGSNPDATQLLALAEQLGAGPAIRRIGSLAEGLDLVGLAGKLEPLAPPRSDLELDPGLRRSSDVFRDGKWRIRWPADPRAVAREVAQ
jgi:predicted transcriptional regulator of viral defense system